MIKLKKLLRENYKTQAKKFIDSGVDVNIVMDYLNKFKRIRDAKYGVARDGDIMGLNVAKGNDRFDIDKYRTFKEVEVFVDYVEGQVKLSRNKNKKDNDSNGGGIEGEEVVVKNGLRVYCARNKEDSIRYGGGGVKYGWCVSRADSGNMYNYYRYGENASTFYFVKDEGRDGTDPWHYFVIQVTDDGTYIITSALNNGDMELPWNEIVDLVPKLRGMQEYFKSIPISERERRLYKKFRYGIDDEEFKKLTYDEKSLYLDIISGEYVTKLSDVQFFSLPEDLKNKYIGFGTDISKGIYEYIKGNNKLYNRFIDISWRRFMGAMDGSGVLNDNVADCLLGTERGLNYLRGVDMDKAIGVFIDYGVVKKPALIFGKDKINEVLLKDRFLTKHPALLFFRTDMDEWDTIVEIYGEEKMREMRLNDSVLIRGNFTDDKIYRLINLVLEYRKELYAEEIFKFTNLKIKSAEFYEFVAKLIIDKKIYNEDTNFLTLINVIVVKDININILIKMLNVIGMRVIGGFDPIVFLTMFCKLYKKNSEITKRLFLKGLKDRVCSWLEVETLQTKLNTTFVNIIKLLGGPEEFRKNVNIGAHNSSIVLGNQESEEDFKYVASALRLNEMGVRSVIQYILTYSRVGMDVIFDVFGNEIFSILNERNLSVICGGFLTSGKRFKLEKFIDEIVNRYNFSEHKDDDYIIYYIFKYGMPSKFLDYFNKIGKDRIKNISPSVILKIIMDNYAKTDIIELLKIVGPIFNDSLIKYRNSEDWDFINELKGILTRNSYILLELFSYVDWNQINNNIYFILLTYLPLGNSGMMTAEEYLMRLKDVIGQKYIQRALTHQPEIMEKTLRIPTMGDMYIKFYIEILGYDYMKKYVNRWKIRNNIIKVDEE